MQQGPKGRPQNRSHQTDPQIGGLLNECGRTELAGGLIEPPLQGPQKERSPWASFAPSRRRVCSGMRCGLPYASFLLMRATLRTQWHQSMVHFYEKFPDQFCGQSKIAIYGTGTVTRSRSWRSEHATWRSGFAV